MSKPKTHYAMPMTMGRSICRVGKAVTFAMGGGGGGHPARVHASTVELGDIVRVYRKRGGGKAGVTSVGVDTP